MEKYGQREIPPKERRNAEEDDHSSERSRNPSRSNSLFDAARTEYHASRPVSDRSRPSSQSQEAEEYQARKAGERLGSRPRSVSDHPRSSYRSQERKPAENLHEAIKGATYYLQCLIESSSESEWKKGVHEALKSLGNNDFDGAFNSLRSADLHQQIEKASRVDKGRRWHAEDYVAQALKFQREREKEASDGTAQELPAHFPPETSAQRAEQTGRLADVQYSNLDRAGSGSASPTDRGRSRQRDPAQQAVWNSLWNALHRTYTGKSSDQASSGRTESVSPMQREPPLRPQQGYESPRSASITGERSWDRWRRLAKEAAEARSASQTREQPRSPEWDTRERLADAATRARSASQTREQPRPKYPDTPDQVGQWANQGELPRIRRQGTDGSEDLL